MPVISAIIRKARVWRSCDTCYKPLGPGQEYVRAYGYAHTGDKPWVLYMHYECAGTEVKEKVCRARTPGS